MSYTKILKPPPLDDLNVEDPPYKILKNLYTPPHLYECFNTVNSEHCISQDPELLFPLHTFALQLRSGCSSEFDLLFVLQLEYLRYTDPNSKPFVSSLTLRESTFITPRGGDEDVLKKAHIFTGPLLRLLVNFRCPLSKFLKFSMPPPPSLQNSESKEYNPEFSLIIDTICSSSRCLIYSSMCFSSTKIPTCCSFTSLAPDEMAPSLKKHFRLALGAKLLTGCCCPSFSVVGVLNTFM